MHIIKNILQTIGPILLKISKSLVFFLPSACIRIFPDSLKC
jgi:hypothetical protein